MRLRQFAEVMAMQPKKSLRPRIFTPSPVACFVVRLRDALLFDLSFPPTNSYLSVLASSQSCRKAGGVIPAPRRPHSSLVEPVRRGRGPWLAMTPPI